MPPPSIASNSIVEVSTIGRLAGQTVMLVRHFRFQGFGGSAIDLPVLQTNVVNAFNDLGGLGLTLTEAMSNDVTGLKLRIQVISPVRYAYYEVDLNPAVGQIASVSEPPGTSGAITLQADTTGRHSRGTMHMFGVPKANTVTGLIDETLRDLYDAVGIAYTGFLWGDESGDNMVSVIFNRTTPTASHEVTHHAVQSEARTMRRRVVGRGS